LENVGVFYAHLEHITAIWYSLWPYGDFFGNYIYIFPHFGKLCQEKAGSPGREHVLLWPLFGISRNMPNRSVSDSNSTRADL
jgi:hypothetical protein